jgi:hypothetical protein
MGRILRTLVTGLILSLPLVGLAPVGAEAQGRGNRDLAATPAAVTLSVELKAQIGDFYSSRSGSNVEALPPGIRRRLERGKPLPPGIAKRTAPPELQSRLELPAGFEIVEVGLDVLLVEVATDIVHEVLMDIVR